LAHDWYPSCLTPLSLVKDRSNNYSVFVDVSGNETIKASGREFDTGITTPNGGLNAPLGDLVRWVAFLTGKNSPATRPILSRTSLVEMWRPVVVVNTSAERRESMGLSFFLDPRTGRARSEHDESRATCGGLKSIEAAAIGFS